MYLSILSQPFQHWISIYAFLAWFIVIHLKLCVIFSFTLLSLYVPICESIPDWQSMAENWELWMLFSFLPASLFSPFVTFMRSKLLLTFWDGHRGRGKPIVPDNVTTIATGEKNQRMKDKCQELVSLDFLYVQILLEETCQV